jgi:hypothetical protein
MERGYLLARHFVVLVSENAFLLDEIRMRLQTIRGVHVCSARILPTVPSSQPGRRAMSAFV